MITPPHRDFPIVRQDRIAEQTMEGWIIEVTELVNQLELAIESLPTFTSGTGSPEGVVTANENSFYIDTAGPTAYQKVGSGNTGWFAV